MIFIEQMTTACSMLIDYDKKLLKPLYLTVIIKLIHICSPHRESKADGMVCATLFTSF